MSELSGYRLMWLVALFDLPVRTKAERREATLYRKRLLEQGFSMAQLSVYMKFCRDKEQSEIIIRKLSQDVPEGGRVDILMITDRQYAGIVTVRDNERVRRKNPSQLSLF
ncbi:CRISPR-associated endonuclease Cas2 [Demequina sediminicola]|uniref:CRISPR-associated endonuclease Cas2 n=1 Tax=Demequina sediminicola TaxID=1095026 RepID=UPI0007862797|nr:CRISPR-associated endonuclease Cas2 [Demequina sediminicola]